MTPYAPVELAGKTTDCPFVADVGLPQATGGEPADPVPGLDHDHAAPLPPDLHRGGDAGRRTAVHDHVVPLFGGRRLVGGQWTG